MVLFSFYKMEYAWHFVDGNEILMEMRVFIKSWNHSKNKCAVHNDAEEEAFCITKAFSEGKYLHWDGNSRQQGNAFKRLTGNEDFPVKKKC